MIVLKLKVILQKKTIEKLVNENAVLVKAIDEANNALASSNATYDTLCAKLETAESSKILCKASLKDIKKSALQEMNHANSTIKTLEKSVKVLEKEVHNLKRDLENTRQNLKNIKSAHSSLKISKTKLETEKIKLEKAVSQKDSKIAKLNKKEGLDLNKNYLKLENSQQFFSLPSKSKQEPDYYPPSSISCPLYSSMITHWNSLPLEISTFTMMVTHTVQPPPPSCSLGSKEEFQEMIDKMCERVFAKLGWEKYK